MCRSAGSDIRVRLYGGNRGSNKFTPDLIETFILTDIPIGRVGSKIQVDPSTPLRQAWQCCPPPCLSGLPADIYLRAGRHHGRCGPADRPTGGQGGRCGQPMRAFVRAEMHPGQQINNGQTMYLFSTNNQIQIWCKQAIAYICMAARQAKSRHN